MRNLRAWLIASLCLMGVCPSWTFAQVAGPTAITQVSGGACTDGTDCARFALGSNPSLTISVTNTFTGTLTFEATPDGVNWFTTSLANASTGALATTTTTTGVFTFTNLGYLQIRARATAWTSGTATVRATNGTASSRGTAPETTFGTVTSFSCATANGVSCTVATPTTTPAATYTLGAITPSSVNGNTITTGSGTLTLGAGSTLATSATNSITLTSTAGTNVTLPTTGTLATLAGSEALTNKTVNGNTITSGTGTLTLGAGSTLATSATNSITLTSTGGTNVTLPTTGTLATLAGSEALSNKTYAGSTATLSTLTSGRVTTAGTSGLLQDSANLTFDGTTLTATAIAAPLTGVNVTAAPSNQTATGMILTLTYGESIVPGDLLYVKSDGAVWKADANAIVFPVSFLALETASSGSHTVLACGIYRDDTRYNFTVGGLVYLAIAAGGETQTVPAATNDLDQVVGIAMHADRLYFCPSRDYVIHS